jgi:hypothetical protein
MSWSLVKSSTFFAEHLAEIMKFSPADADTETDPPHSQLELPIPGEPEGVSI